MGSVRHVLTKQESRQQEAGTQVPPPPSGIDGYVTVGLFSKQKQQGGEEANFFPGNRPLKHCKDGRTVRKPVPPVSSLT